MTTEEAISLRKLLEMDLLALLKKYRDDTGLTPKTVDVQTADVPINCGGSDRSVMLLSVRVTVEI